MLRLDNSETGLVIGGILLGGGLALMAYGNFVLGFISVAAGAIIIGIVKSWDEPTNQQDNTVEEG